MDLHLLRNLLAEQAVFKERTSTLLSQWFPNFDNFLDILRDTESVVSGTWLSALYFDYTYLKTFKVLSSFVS
jgi:hypothetical protein